MSKILDYLFLGSLENSIDYNFLINNNIKIIINVSTDDNYKYDNIKYYKLEMLDTINQPIIFVIDHVNEIIEKEKYNGNILIHCYVGKSRSVSCVIGYLIYKYGWNLEKSFKFIKEKRPIINPNSGFMYQLMIYNNRYENNNNKYYIIIIFLIYFILFNKLNKIY